MVAKILKYMVMGVEFRISMCRELEKMKSSTSAEERLLWKSLKTPTQYLIVTDPVFAGIMSPPMNKNIDGRLMLKEIVKQRNTHLLDEWIDRAYEDVLVQWLYEELGCLEGRRRRNHSYHIKVSRNPLTKKTSLAIECQEPSFQDRVFGGEV
jgi:hypothetical protein